MRERRKASWLFVAAGALLFVLAGVLLAAGGRHAWIALQKPVELDGLSPNGLEGRYVTAQVSSVLDEYAQLELPAAAGEEARITGREYVIYLPDGENVMALLVGGEELPRLQEALNALITEGETAPPVELKGLVAPMEEGDKALFQDALAFYSLSEGMAVYSVLEVGTVEGVPLGQAYLLFWLAALAALLGILSAVLALKGALRKKLR